MKRHSSRHQSAADSRAVRVKLGDILRCRSEVVHPRNNPSGPATFVGLEHIESETGRLLGSVAVQMAQLTGRKPRFYKGDVVYGYLRPYLNKVWVAEFGGLCSVDQYVYEVAEIADPEYVALFMRSPLYFRRAPTGITPGQLPRIRKEEVASVEIELPPLPEQCCIAAILKDQLATVERARVAAQAQLAAAQALPSAELRDVFESDEARNWMRCRLGDLIDRHNKIIHPGDRADGESVFVGLEHIEPNTGRRIGSLRLDLANLTGRKPTFRKGQIVYGYLRPYLNKVWIADFDGCSSVDQFAFEVRPDRADASLIAAFMRSDTFLSRSAVVTTTGQLPRISIDEILAVEIDLPSTVDEQSRVAAELSRRLGATNQLIASCQDQLEFIKGLPAALLRQAFQGRL